MNRIPRPEEDEVEAKPTRRRPTRMQDIVYAVGVLTTVILSNVNLSRQTQETMDDAVERLEKENRRLHERVDMNQEDLARVVDAIKTVHPECKGLP